jgi:ribonucleotide monophosphatase NagD (HAD superfamily)
MDTLQATLQLANASHELNDAFRALIDGAELIALQHNRYWRRADGLVLDVGAYSAALEYGAGCEAVVVGKPAPPSSPRLSPRSMQRPPLR